jgi:hypothetical protein
LRAIRITSIVLFFLVFPTLVWSQSIASDGQAGPGQQEQNRQIGSAEASASQSDAGTQSKPQTALTAPAPGSTQMDPKNADNSEGKQTKRMFWIVPNFAAVNADTQLPPLTVRGKFVLGTWDSMDYSSFVWAGLVAAQSMALKSYPELHQGLAGYGRYYWRAFADQASGAFFTEAIVPVLTHEDPRYYTLGHGGFFRRTAYSLSRVVLTKTDSGGTRFNSSEIVGNAMEAGLSNVYYPPQERGLRNTAVNWATQLEAAALNNFFREFWPDIRNRLVRHK